MFNPFKDQKSTEVMKFSLSKEGYSFKLGDNFVLGEFASKDGADEILIHPACLVLLDHFREKWGKPISINSGYRSPSHNKKIGGATNSYHVLGMAQDIDVFGVKPIEVAEYAETLVGGVGRYNTFTHIDVGPLRRWKG